MSMRIGQMDQRLTVQSSTQSVDSGGQAHQQWSNFLSNLSARAEFLSGRELEGMKKINTEIVVKFTVRFRTDITEQMRVIWRNKIWNIHSVLPWERKDYMTLAVSKVE